MTKLDKKNSAVYRKHKIESFELNRVYRADCIESMKQLPTDSIDVAIADPPYNLSKGGMWKWDNSIKLPGFGGDWSKVMAKWDDMQLSDYFSFTLAWISELKRVVRPTGSLWVHGTYHNIGIINFAMQILEIEIINEVVWYKRNSFPNLSGRRLTASHETILWAHTGNSKSRNYYFAYETSKEMDCPEDALKKNGKQMRTVWDIPNNKKREEIKFGKHPTQKPVRLLMRMIAISAKKGDLLLVPFAGAGSDCVAAKKMGIQFLAFEKDPQYVEICKNRLVNSQPDNQLSLFDVTKQKTEERKKTEQEIFQTPRKAKNIPAVIKWTGSKRFQANAIADLIPPHKRYFEPFLGGGALLFLAASSESVAGDLYEPLIQLWRLIQTDHKKVIEDYENQWNILNKELDGLDIKLLKRGDSIPKYYYKVRERFNKLNGPLDLNFLMRTCVNGIVRFNKKGKFNNSFHLSRRGMNPQRFKSIVEKWFSVIHDVEFVCQDYTKTMEMAGKDDFVYCDPPYAGNRQRYIGNLNLEVFFDALKDLNDRGTKWALSFDGRRGAENLIHAVPESLYKQHLFLDSGNSSVKNVLNASVERVEESLYLNY